MDVRFSHKPYADLTRDELYALLHLRDVVFVVGQKVTAEPEVDGLDPQCVHVLGYDGTTDRLVATARVFADQRPMKVGRVAVAPDLQRGGVGTRLMRYVQAEIVGDAPGIMSAQAHLEAWYTRLGWRRVGALYREAEIPHVKMVRP